MTDQTTTEAPAGKASNPLDLAIGKAKEQVPHEIVHEQALEDSVQSFHAKVPAEAFEAKTAEVLKDLTRQVAIPGFRPGKAPMALVRNRFRREAKEDAVRSMAPKIAEAIVAAKSLRPIGEALLEGWEEGEDGLLVKMLFEVRPVVSITEESLQGIVVEAQSADVADKDIDERIEALRQRDAAYEASEDGAIEADDAIVADIRVLSDDGDEQSHKGQYIEDLGGNFPAPVVAALVGRKKGDAVEAEDTHEHGDHSHTTKYAITINEVKKRVLPAVDDDFAKDVSDDYETVADLRAGIGKELAEDFANRQRAQILDGAYAELAKRVDFPVPQTLVRNLAGQQIDQTEERLRQMGMSLENMGKEFIDRYVERALGEAKDEVRRMLLAEAVADFWKVEATDEAMEAEFARLAESQGRKPLAVRAAFEAQGRLEAFKADLRVKLANDKLKDSVEVRIVEELSKPGEDADGGDA